MRGTPAFVVLGALSVLLGGCEKESSKTGDAAMPDSFVDTTFEVRGEDIDEPLGCEETAAGFAVTVTGQLDGLTACTGDGECVLVEPDLECPDVGVHLVECPMAVNADSATEFEERIAALAETFCAAGVPPCLATPGCPPGEAKCADGQCQFVLGEP
jgi:hypothetical protein